MIKDANRIVTMDTYLRRTYAHKKAVAENNGNFPFWDYRSRRGAFSSSNSSFSSGNSSCDGSSISSISSRSESGSENISVSDHSDTDSLLPCEPQKLTVQFLTDAYEVTAMEEIFQPIINWIDPDLHVIKITDKSECLDNVLTSLPSSSSRLPSMALMIFLQEDGMVGFERIQTVKRYFEKAPWKFHHSEEVHRGTINPYPYNSQDFYYTSEDLPLWAVRQVHTGKEFFRVVLFVSESNWQSMSQFYKLVLGNEPDLKREDFCLFTVSVFNNFNIQLALKKLQGDTKPRPLDSVQIQFRVSDISNIIPLLPNVCRPLSDSRWQTTDPDGNVVVMEIPCFFGNSTFLDRCSLSDRSSISGRSSRNSSVSNARSENRLCRDGHQRNSVETRRRASPLTQRTKSLIVDQKLIDRIRNNNIHYKEQAMKLIRQQHSQLENNNRQQQQHSQDTSTSENSITFSNTISNDTSSSNSDMSTTEEPTLLKSFYV